MTLRTLLTILVVVLAGKLALEAWDREESPEASLSEEAPVPEPLLYGRPHYEDHADGLPASDYYDSGPRFLFDEEWRDARSADEGAAFAPDLYSRFDAPTVTRIVDGDTFELSDGRRVRLTGIDTPEVHPSGKLSRDAERTGMDKETIRELGRRSSAYAAELALGMPVELEYGSGSRTDRYGRTLAYVWVLNEQGERLYRVNDRLVADGYANIYSGIPFEYSDEYLEYERRAREEGRGLWGEASLGEEAWLGEEEWLGEGEEWLEEEEEWRDFWIE